jgi:hypothetical protein
MIENYTWEQNLSTVDAFSGTILFGDVNNDGRLERI